MSVVHMRWDSPTREFTADLGIHETWGYGKNLSEFSIFQDFYWRSKFPVIAIANPRFYNLIPTTTFALSLVSFLISGIS